MTVHLSTKSILSFEHIRPPLVTLQVIPTYVTVEVHEYGTNSLASPKSKKGCTEGVATRLQQFW